MELRGWIEVRGIEVESDAAGRLLTSLEARHGDLGPVLSGTGDGFEVILATDRPTEAEAAAELYAAVCDALRVVGLGERYPVGLKLEPADVPELAGI